MQLNLAGQQMLDSVISIDIPRFSCSFFMRCLLHLSINKTAAGLCDIQKPSTLEEVYSFLDVWKFFSYPAIRNLFGKKSQKSYESKYISIFQRTLLSFHFWIHKNLKMRHNPNQIDFFVDFQLNFL